VYVRHYNYSMVLYKTPTTLRLQAPPRRILRRLWTRCTKYTAKSVPEEHTSAISVFPRPLHARCDSRDGICRRLNRENILDRLRYLCQYVYHNTAAHHDAPCEIHLSLLASTVTLRASRLARPLTRRFLAWCKAATYISPCNKNHASANSIAATSVLRGITTIRMDVSTKARSRRLNLWTLYRLITSHTRHHPRCSGLSA
jgi:hypothetical protein